jgi:16S rRNA (guanine527-N7)-methyltransferase
MDLLRESAKSLGLTLSAEHLAAFELYYRELDAWNKRFNLTAITGYEEVQSKHLLDSLSCALAFPQESDGEEIPDTIPLQRASHSLLCADVGSGAGFPGLPLKILLPDIRMTLIEATGKKVAFLRHMVEALNLQGVELLHARAEDVGQCAQHRQKYDVVLSRAVAHLAVLAEYCLPLCRLGGRMIAQKGQGAHQEAEDASAALRMLGGAPLGIKALNLPDLPGERYLVVVRKTSHTPSEYPRRPGIPSKKPLGMC